MYSFDTHEKGQLLVIEDTAGDARLLRIYLSESDFSTYNLVIKTNLQEGMSALADTVFDAVLLDLNLPDSRGFETIQTLFKAFPDANVIVMTGSDDKELGVKAVKAGAQDFIQKGQINTDSLAKSLRYSIERTLIRKNLEEAQRIAHIANWEYDVHNEKYRVSDEMYNIIDVSIPPKNITQDFIKQFIHPADLETYIQVYRDLREGKPTSVDIRVVRTDGTIRYVFFQSTSQMDYSGIVFKIRGIVQDITARKIAEIELRKSQERYQTIFSQSQDAIYVSSRDGKMIDFNEATCKLLGRNRLELLNLDLKEIYLNPDDRKVFVKIIDQQNFIKDFEVDIITKAREIRHCMLTAARIQTDNFDGYHGILRDVTEIRQTEELRKAKELAERTAQMKERFLANVSHEIRTPMNAIVGMTNILLKSALTEDQFFYANSIKLASENLLTIINDILEISQLKSGTVSYHPKPFNLKEQLQNICNILSFKTIEKNISLDLHIDPYIPKLVIGDTTRFNQILLNLAGNAIKFTDNGFVKITASQHPQSENNHIIEIRVEDTGEGIDVEKINSIFEMFVQVSDDFQKSQGGTGLGLAIVKQIVDMMHGKIDVESEKGKGSAFTVTLPFEVYDESDRGNESVEHIELEPSLEFLNKKIKILLAEDHKMNQIVAKKILEGELKNLDLTVVSNGLEALEKFKTEDFDLILMDIQMPEMDGYEATKHIREDFAPPKSQTPILALTAHAFISQNTKFKDFGMDGYVLKPFETKELIHTIFKFLEK